MLPILRIVPVGGVLLAIMILALALDPPGGSHPALPAAMLPARGALMQASEHPEWRPFLILAAVRRADELNHLRELPDTPVRTEGAQDAPKVAGLPTERSDTDPDDATGTITEMPGVTIPVEIRETSLTELPVAAPEEKPPVIRTPERGKSPSESRRNSTHRPHHAKVPAKPKPAAQINLLEALFGGSQQSQPATARADSH
jgi:hypothetical protein